METNFEKIKALLANSSVSVDDQQLFLESCEGVVDHNLELMMHLFSENPQWIEKIIQDYKRKKQVVVENDMRAWREIVADEVQELKDLQKLKTLRSSAL